MARTKVVIVGAGFGGQTDLSGGQWQRLALARLIYQDAPVIILDEPVASLDPQGERAVFELFSQLAKSRIIIFTTHRYDSIPSSTKIVVLMDGNIAESGTHEELLQQQRDYWSLYMTEASSKAVPLLAGQNGHADHTIHAMNGQTNRKTKLSVAAFALRPHAPSPETALPSDPAGESAPQFATAVSSGQVVEAPGSDSSEESALAHSTPSSLSTAPASLPPTPLALASHCNGNHLCPNMNVEMSFSQLGCEWSISSRQDDAQATTVREKDTAETSRLYKSQPCRRVKEYSYGSRA